jgi:Predicted nucleotidyltransferase.
MGSIVHSLAKKQLLHTPPDYVINQVQYEVIMGSVAYGVFSDMSDVDIYGFCIPDKEVIFPHLAGEILGFGKQKKRFEQFQQHHIDVPAEKKQYDVTIFSIIRYFQLCMENNPNMVDSLFVPQRCILHCSAIGNLVRENRRTFFT